MIEKTDDVRRIIGTPLPEKYILGVDPATGRDVSREAPRRRNEFIEELVKFRGSEITVTTARGKVYEGVCSAVSHSDMWVVLRTPREKIVIRDVVEIRRKRTHPFAGGLAKDEKPNDSGPLEDKN